MRRTVHRIPPALRAEVCAEAYGRCQACMAPCADGHVHHRKQRSVGGRDELPNLIWLHPLCHAAVHDDSTSRPYELGLLLRSWDDPESAPVKPWIAYVTGEAS